MFNTNFRISVNFRNLVLSENCTVYFVIYVQCFEIIYSKVSPHDVQNMNEINFCAVVLLIIGT